MKRQAENQRNAVCDVCGFVYKHYELRKRWDGFMVCDKDWETRHPMDFQRVPRTEKGPEWTRPERADVEIVVPYIDSSIGTQETAIPAGTFNNEL